jgi:LmbE family N-acetylglucosaminyl deacetylase/SAM-dependent methyltransferase
VVSFDARVDGTSVEAWSADDRLDKAPLLVLDGVTSLLVVAAHPDDETLGAGGVIADCARRGIPVTVVVVTDGSASESNLDPVALADVRAAELREAVLRLDPAARIELLGTKDGRTRENRADIHSRLQPVFDELDDGALVLAPWRGDGHRDHRIVGEVCVDLAHQRGVTLLEYPIWMWHWATPTGDAVPWGHFVVHRESDSDARLKRNAVAAFHSQLDGVLLPSFVRHFATGREFFIRPEPTDRDDSRIGAAYFDDLYARHDDPWGFDSRWYERRKRLIALATLPREHYGRTLEIGCSTGALSADLAERCSELLAVDVSGAAVERARVRLADTSNATVERVDIATEFPSGSFDLIVLSEVGYYFDRESLDRLLGDILAHLAEGGTLLACHWLHPVEDYLLDGAAVHAAIDALPGLHRLARHLEADFILEVYSSDGRSVAQREGLVE